MINVIICDDNEKDRNTVEALANDFFTKNNIEYNVHTFNDYNKKFYSVVENKMPFKIYLLDIETPSRSGIDVARDIRKKDVDSVIIFLTVHEELGNIVLKNDLMFLSFINKFDNLESRLKKALFKSLDLLYKKQVIRFTDKNILYTLNINDILYITTDSFERKTVIKTDYGEFRVNKTLGDIISLLDERFIQTHRACYINSERKVKIDKTNKIITFDTGEEIDLLSDKYKKEVV